MSSQSGREFIRRQLDAVPPAGCVLDVGAQDINGSVRGLLGDRFRYVGVDLTVGPGVDIVGDIQQLDRFLRIQFDAVICAEVLEHVLPWKTAFAALSAATRPGGYLVVTTRSPGFPYHGYPKDHWRYTLGDMRQIFAGWRMVALEDDPEAPGVFVCAQKLDANIDAAALAGYEVLNIYSRRNVLQWHLENLGKRFAPPWIKSAARKLLR